jgi:hypothetical protein
MGVRVHKAGQNGITAGIQQVRFRMLEQQFRRRADCQDEAAVQQD